MCTPTFYFRYILTASFYSLKIKHFRVDIEELDAAHFNNSHINNMTISRCEITIRLIIREDYKMRAFTFD